MNNDRIQYLINRISRFDDEVAFDEFMSIYLPGLLSFAQSYTKNKSISEEIIGDVFFSIWKNRSVLPSLINVANYLYISTKNASLRYKTSKGAVNERLKIDIDSVGDNLSYNYVDNNNQILAGELLSKINLIIEEFPPQRKLIFRLIKDEHMRYKEVANLLEISVKAVEKQMTIGYQRIATVLRPEYPEYKSYFGKVSKK